MSRDPLCTETVMKLLGFCSAYPEDVFPPLTKAELAELPSGVVDRASAAMGRHLAKFAKEAADVIESQHKEIERLRGEMKRINDLAIHLNSEGRDPDEKFYSKRDVEALIAITRAVEKKHG